MFSKNKSWSPLYFLSALGAGGMIATFFMYLLFWIEHPNQPIPVYEDIVLAFSQGSQITQLMIGVALFGIAIFGALHIILLVWNLSQYKQWKMSGALEEIKGKNAHTQLLVIPLTLAMSINAGFIMGAVFIPQLWSVVEYLFPIALSGFVVLGIWAMRLYFDFFSQTVSENQFDNTANNSLAQLLPGFAFAMISVGLTAPAAMSTNNVTVTFSIVLASIFIIPAIFITLVKLVIGITHMLEHGANKMTLPTLWIGVPILTTLSIAMMRIDHGLAHTLGVSEAASSFLFLTLIFSAQLFLILLGTAVMKKMNYFNSLHSGEEKSPIIFALICPGVAFTISLQFFINKGLVAIEVMDKFSVAYWSLTSLTIALQLITAVYLIKFINHLVVIKKEPVTLTA